MRYLMLFCLALMLSPAVAAACERSCAAGTPRDPNGCCLGVKKKKKMLEHRPKARAAAGTNTGPCYGNGTCNAGLSCVDSLCQGASAKAGIEWVSLAGGSFQMGSDDRDKNEKPRHEVRLKGFQLAKSEVTVAQYRVCVDAGVCSAPQTHEKYCPPELFNWDKGDREDHPVNCVDWNQARTFSAWIGGRLPSEAEWEYAATSGGKDRKYAWGDAKADCGRAVMGDGKTLGAGGCGRKSTWPVCSKPRGNTTQGLCDMAGNVWEWVEDRYTNSYQSTPRDGSPYTGAGSDSVLRGGGWALGASYLRAALRSSSEPGYRFSALGIRPARSLP